MSSRFHPAQQANSDLPGRYLDLIERALTHTLYASLDVRVTRHDPLMSRRVFRRLLFLLHRHGVEPMRLLPVDAVEREVGLDWPIFAQTMIGRKRLANLRACVESVLDDQVPGDLIEAGVWRGGAGILMRAVLQARHVDDRDVWLADSFAGLPPPRPEEHPADAGATWHTYSSLAIPLEEVRANFERYCLLDEHVRFLPGWFADTLPGLREHRWAVIRIDADMYGSTIEALENLYPGLSPGGYTIVDDYRCVEACRRAVDEYRRREGIEEPIQIIDWAGVYWRRDGS
jgi:O-methyltransferase